MTHRPLITFLISKNELVNGLQNYFQYNLPDGNLNDYDMDSYLTPRDNNNVCRMLDI